MDLFVTEICTWGAVFVHCIVGFMRWAYLQQIKTNAIKGRHYCAIYPSDIIGHVTALRRCCDQSCKTFAPCRSDFVVMSLCILSAFVFVTVVLPDCTALSQKAKRCLWRFRIIFNKTFVAVLSKFLPLAFLCALVCIATQSLWFRSHLQRHGDDFIALALSSLYCRTIFAVLTHCCIRTMRALQNSSSIKYTCE